MNGNTFSKNFIGESLEILKSLDISKIEEVILEIEQLKKNKGRIFFCGVGGSAGHASHAVNDFRKLAGIESYSPTDNVSEITARANDEGWETIFIEYLKVSNLTSNDALFILSVGGGSENPEVSLNIVRAIDFAKGVGAKIFGIVGKEGGFTLKNSNSTILVPNLFPLNVTPHTEGIAAIIWHLMVSHPRLKERATKW
jgi:D-sedoheptulose 7-phosphate isomerase